MAKKLDINTALINAIYQYVSIAGMNEAAAAIRKQCGEHKIQLQPVSEQNMVKREQAVTQKKKLLAHLEKDECEQFFKRWNELFDEGDKSAEVISLEFYIRLYFATFPLRKSPPNGEEYQERIEKLKKFLEEEGGAKYSADVQLVQYFALPYVAAPGKHPVFKELVQKKWAKNIRESLNDYLTKHTTTVDGAQDALLQKWTAVCQSQYNEKLEKEYRELQDDYYRLVDIVDELFDFLEQSNHGKLADFVSEMKARLADAKAEAEQHIQNSTVGNKTKEKRCRPAKTRLEAKKKDTSMKKSESIGNLIPSDPSTRASPTKNEKEAEELMDHLVEQLNYTKIGNCLIKGSPGRLSCLLLQALRQRITRTPIRSAGHVLKVYANNDLLLLKHLKNSVVSVIAYQGDAGNDAKEEMGRLLNSIASFNDGRNYLLANNQGKQLLGILATGLKTKKLHHYAGEHVLATLQKLSIRSSVQKELVQLGMLEWLSLYLGSKPGAASLDYGCALMLNICVHPSGRSAASRAANIFIATIATLMADHKLSVCNYVNGMLYSVLGVARVKARAKEINLANIVKEKLDRNHCNDDSKQLPIILKILDGDLEAPLNWRLGFNETEGGQEVDYVEAEIESTDTLQPLPNELFGEQLLVAKFRLTDTQEKSAVRSSSSVEREEMATPPGTVPRSQQNRRLSLAAAPPRISAKTKPPVAATVVTLVSDTSRPDSVSSQQTFILENSRRRPLVARDPFKIVADTTARKGKMLTKESFGEMSFQKSSKKSGIAALNWSSKQLQLSQEDNAVEFLPDAPIADDTNVLGYSAVFESKPKLPRTPVKVVAARSGVDEISQSPDS